MDSNDTVETRIARMSRAAPMATGRSLLSPSLPPPPLRDAVNHSCAGLALQEYEEDEEEEEEKNHTYNHAQSCLNSQPTVDRVTHKNEPYSVMRSNPLHLSGS